MKNKKLYIEILRILAIFCVIFNHTGGFYLYDGQIVPSPQFVIYTIISIFSKVAVPLFMMVSGGLLLSKDESIFMTWKNRVVKMIIITVVINVFYYIHNGIMYNMEIQFGDFIKKLYSGTVNGHLWYLYMFIGYLISLPLLRKMVKNMDIKTFVYLYFVALFFTSILPTIEYLCFDRVYILNNNMRVTWIVPNMVLYPCLGYFVENKLCNVSMKKVLPSIWLANIIGIVLSCYMTYKLMAENPKANAQEWLSIFVSVNAFCIYITVKTIFDKIRVNRMISNVICSLGECTFGIYLLHIAVKDRPFMKEFLDKMLAEDYNMMLTYVGFTITVFLLTYVLVFSLRILKRLI